jgi:hypothetical protein
MLPWCRPGMRAQTSARRSDRQPQTSGGGRRGTSLWETFGSACFPRIGSDKTGYGATPGPDCWASSKPQLIGRPLARHRPPSLSLPGLTPFSSYRVSHKRNKRLLANSTRASGWCGFPPLAPSCPAPGQTACHREFGMEAAGKPLWGLDARVTLVGAGQSRPGNRSLSAIDRATSPEGRLLGGLNAGSGGTRARAESPRGGLTPSG